jgi:ABC-2 type transport system ATP-binding protein
VNSIPATQDQESVLQASALSKSFISAGRRVAALQEVSFAIVHGTVTGLIGPDGAGKTTLMRLAAGLLLPDAGSLRVLGLDASRDSLAVQAVLGYMPQRFGLYEDLTVQENLDLYASLQGVPRDARVHRYGELLHMTGLGPFTRRLAGRLSGGMKQKLGLACTLVRAPRLLLLDEPTVGVDPVSRRELWAILDRLVSTQGMSVLLSTAYLDEAERCMSVILLHEGRILEQGTPAVIRQRVAGRTWDLTQPGGSPRELQARLDGRAGVMDALVLGDHVRLVMAPGASAEELVRQIGLQHAVLTPVAPRFEDAFIDLLHERGKTSGAGVNMGGAAAVTQAQATAMENEPVIHVEALRRRFGDFWAVNGVSFSVRRGEIFGLLGANGAGKSTIFRMLCGLLPASEGQLRVAGLDLRTARAAARARIGYMSQSFSLYGNLTVARNLDFFASVYGLGREEKVERIQWALAEFALADHTEQPAADLPLGYKQRLAMACALLHRPEILFLDEPTSGVDPLARREFWRRINALARTGVTVLVTTHFMEEAEYCDRLAIMAAGRMLTVDTPRAIKAGARSAQNPEPSMEEAFLLLARGATATELAA